MKPEARRPQRGSLDILTGERKHVDGREEVEEGEGANGLGGTQGTESL